ncbi:hypothetical protein SPRG_22108 [Saprolegnia parasitica CBS 223.65]|uniref:Tripeptidyl-peptidase II n=1 Tax=Saprolegnia parasitica (strain CBS 223.65) TaxID=695850 RepID=A0A067CQ41_SAPPC|nr:hypothetical protein SPRG_22108 [Saprolegnia parasitica CBS 223.65]KDO32799.1 hypothetical protein SPRG_22108 [Saprolegnia parasitica CBS 223.65]|eukprot:XP_012196675.1 hypothetical protein SPRG_22108 [Saprolegnia parasitica CBS 223.65]
MAGVPTSETGVDGFLRRYPTYDGRNTIIAIFDTGVDMGAAGLQVTTDGKPKLLDVIDATGANDVDMSTVVKAKDGKLKVGKKTWTLNPSWTAVDGTFRIGSKRAYELFPAPLVKRLKAEAKDAFLVLHRAAIDVVQTKLVAWETSERTVDVRRDLLAQLSLLDEAAKRFDDQGPVYDCILFFDGAEWRAAIDSSGHCDFSAIEAMGVYHKQREFRCFSDASQLHYAFNVYDNGDVLSIVCDAGSHGTHVASIVAGHDPKNAANNGIAPGAQLVSIKIGDTRMGSSETGTAISRGILAVFEHKCDVVNMSYGEHVVHPNRGRSVDLINELVHGHSVTFVGSVGNDGPALGTTKGPCGLSSSILGVGAYVSPAMMATVHSMCPPLAEAALYTWSSRGPSLDGDNGISVVAPGGAITSVPNWTLTKQQLKNGTSMAAPHCAGVLSLLISGLKAQQLPYHPYSLRRALEATATPLPGVGAHEQGCGLVNAPAAFDHAVRHGPCLSGQPWFLDVHVTAPGRPTARGICLREPFEVTPARVERTIKLTPVFPKAAPNADRIAYAKTLRLVATQPWVRVPSTLTLCNEGRSFVVSIDLKHVARDEVHDATILAFETPSDTTPCVRIPVTVIKPQVATDVVSFTASVAPGKVHRTFLTVPAGATWLNLCVATPGSQSPTVVLHLNQYESMTRPNAKYLHKRFVPDLAPDAGISMSVRADATLELAIAPFWNTSGGSVTLRVDGIFRGILPDPSQVTLHAGDGTARVNLRAILRTESVLPDAKLQRWTQRLRPTSAHVSPCSLRSAWPDHRSIYQLVLSYKVTQADDGRVVWRLPLLNGQLYDSPFEAQLLMVFDALKNLVSTSDAYPTEMPLAKGSYVVRVQIRHHEYSILNGLTQSLLVVDRSIKDVVLPVYAAAESASTQAKPMATTVLAKGAELPIFVGEPPIEKLPKGAAPGDVLTGRITYGKTQLETWRGASCKPNGFALTYTVPPSETKFKEPEAKDAKNASADADALRDFLVNRVTKKIGKDDFLPMWQNLLATYPGHLPLLRAHLQHLDVEKTRLDHLSAIVAAADALLAQLLPDLPTLAAYYGLKAQPSALRKENDKKKALLVDALGRKARALADAANEMDFVPTYTLLQQWASTPSDVKHLHAALYDDTRRGLYGLALQRLHAMTSSVDKPSVAKEILDKKIALCRMLGWTHLAATLTVVSPKDYAPF